MNDYQKERAAAETLAKSLLPDAGMFHIVSCSAPIPTGKNHEFLTLREEIVVKSIRRATAQAAGVRITALEVQNAELLAALQEVLKTRAAEAKAATAYATASENFDDAGREGDTHMRAMVAASTAEKNARTVIAKSTGSTS